MNATEIYIISNNAEVDLICEKLQDEILKLTKSICPIKFSSHPVMVSAFEEQTDEREKQYRVEIVGAASGKYSEIKPYIRLAAEFVMHHYNFSDFGTWNCGTIIDSKTFKVA